jgi:hypothetical protein
MNPGEGQGEDDDSTGAPTRVWRIHIAARRPRQSALAALAFVAIAVGLGVTYRAPIYSILGFGLLFGSTAAYWTPRHYKLYADRIEVVVMGRAAGRPWSQFLACFRDSDAVFLSPTGLSTGLARFRGLTVFLPPDGDDVAAEIEHYVTAGRNDSGA